jgi:hypothetical protein
MNSVLRLAPLMVLTIAMPAAAAVKIDLFPNYGPQGSFSHGAYDPGFTPSPSLFVYGANAIGAMLDGELSRGGSLANTPTAFNTLPDNKIDYNFIRRTEFPSWGDQINPSGAFVAEKGSVWRVGVRVESTTPFTASDLHYSVDNPLENESSTLADFLNQSPEGGYAPSTAVGIYFGADGIRGTADDVVCDNLGCDPLTQPLNLVAWRGFSFSEFWTADDLQSIFGGDWQALLADDRAFWSGLDPYAGLFDIPFTTKEKFTLVGAAGEALAVQQITGVVTPVPEPANWAFLVAGFGLMGAALRGRRQAVVV